MTEEYGHIDNLNDEELVSLAQQGDADAMLCLLNRYKKNVLMKARGYFLVGAEQDDLVQEGMIGLVKAIRDYLPDRNASFAVFSDLCIKRQMITAIKTASRLKHTPLNNYISLNRPYHFEGEEGERTLIDVLKSESIGPEDEALERESIRNIESYYQKTLSKLEKDVLRLFLQGKSYQDIAIELNRHTKAVDNALQRIRKKTREYLLSQIDE